MPASRARFVDDDVPGHGEQPAALRAACLFEYASVAPGAEHGLLHDVLRFDSVTAVEADDIGPQGTGVLVVEGAKQVGVTPGHQSHAHAARSPLIRGMTLGRVLWILLAGCGSCLLCLIVMI